MEKLRVGFIGCGRHATKNLYPSLHYAPIYLVSVCDIDEKKARRNASWFGAEKYYTDYREMLEKEKFDAVFIVCSPNMHKEISIDVLSKGYHIFLEKPPAINLAGIEEINKASIQSGKTVMVGMMKRFTPIYNKIKKIIHSTAFGEPNMVEAKFCVGPTKGAGYALLLDSGIHMLDLVTYLLGDVANVSFKKYQLDSLNSSYAIILQFVSGAVGTICISDQQSWMRANERVEITGQGSWITAENLIRYFYFSPTNKVEFWEPGFSIPNDENQSLFLCGYVNEVRYFAESIISGKVPEPGLEQIYKTVSIIKQIEPKENYYKEPQNYIHWESENSWLNVNK